MTLPGHATFANTDHRLTWVSGIKQLFSTKMSNFSIHIPSHFILPFYASSWWFSAFDS